MNERPAVTTFLFTDIEGSSHLWEAQPERMRPALARHDHILRDAIERHHGAVVKTTGDGLYAAFLDPRDAVMATVDFQSALGDPAATNGLPLRVRCGMHAGITEPRDGDYFGTAVNRAARIMGAAHGGQILISQTVADLLRDRLPEGISLRDLGTVRLRDLSSDEHLYQLDHENLRREFPPLRSLEAIPHNLPEQVTSFIGRERERQEVKAALQTARLLTLSGIGGLGKTRLSLQVAAEVLNQYPDGVWFVELASITDERLVADAVASVLGVKEAAGQPAAESIARYVRDRHLLLVLDNCEHLVRSCAALAKHLLQAGARVQILATSREHFNIAGEKVYLVPPLSVPRPSASASTETIMQCEAVRLFVERAAAIQPTFQITAANAPAVVQICQRLDGIPLALELAAARVRALSVEQIAARVDDRFRLLKYGDRTASPRQQTLRGTIDWSYELLQSKEKAVFRRLAVFAGGWTIEAAEAVACCSEIAAAEVLDLLADLIDKSLVLATSDGGRYGFLETVRQYAQERLEESGEAAAVHDRHLAFYLDLAERGAAGLAGPDQPLWLRRLDVERENLLAAHAWCAHSPPHAEADYRLVAATKLYWYQRGLLNIGYYITVEALGLPAAQAQDLPRCRALWVAGQICCFTGKYEEAARYLGESLDICRVHADTSMMAAVQNYLALAALGQGDRAAARRHCGEALDLARELGNKRRVAVATNAMAQLNRLDGDLESAEALYGQVLALADELRDPEYSATGSLGLAMIAIERGNSGRAFELLEKVLAVARETGSKPVAQSALEVSTGLAALQKEWTLCAHLYGAAEGETQRSGFRRDPADDAFLQPLVGQARAALGEAQFSAAEAAGRALPFERAMTDARAWIGRRAGGS